MRTLPLPRFWRLLRTIAKRPTLPAVARAWAGVKDEPSSGEPEGVTTDEDLAAMAGLLGFSEAK